MEDKSKQKKEVEVLVVSGIKGLVERLRVHSDRLLIPKGIELKVINYEGTIAKDIEASGNESDKDIIPYLRNATIMLADPGLLVRVLKYVEPTQLKWLQSTWAGIDKLFTSPHLKEVLHKDSPYSFALTRLGGVFGVPMAEFVFGQILSRERQFPLLQEQQKQKKWLGTEEGYTYRPLTQITIGLMGVGDIGTAIARVAKAFGSKVLGLVREKSNLREGMLDGMYTMQELSTFLAECDYVINVLPSTESTRGLLNNNALKNMKSGGVFINVGRGDIISEEELLLALNQNWISAAVLDVFGKEPLPTESSLWSHSGCTITPHVSAISLPDDVAQLFCENLLRFLDGQTLLFPVDKQKGY